MGLAKRTLSEGDQLRLREEKKLKLNQPELKRDEEHSKRLFLDDCGSSGESDSDEAPEEVSSKATEDNIYVSPAILFYPRPHIMNHLSVEDASAEEASSKEEGADC